MGEVDSVSTTGTYPALPMAGKRRERGNSSPEAPKDDPGQNVDSRATVDLPPRLPRSLIDEYA